MFSKTCEYGIRAIIYIASQTAKGDRVSQKEVAYEIESPMAFTAKILQQLAKKDLVRSVMGPNGGFEIEESRLREIKIGEVVDAIDGDSIYRGCGLGLKDCNAAQPCPLHDKFVKIRNDLRKMLESTSLYDLAMGLENGLSFLKR
ncbi:Rrf2 family transcriptional regulator [Porifericola rhodea]|uniref:RrF2 family transcriptional regulator n=1 Tax=Porifericola rhodea TaxID=930972 RepID=UPI00266538FE|nr:Rrf2 family transcriptional regulator [Porifericola rhodea]WKN33887.1 Rrf2 family transcriptional regulator [Porifericola rhodea]